ncbi:MAG: sigma-70 family RNA polymerase sigma factor [Ruminococcaceae bacterium]|nr:sigma-70 family RNA polymerase sigma factor [Oscillospiraceae bacterium]
MQDTNEMRDRLINEFVENYTEKLFYFCLKKTGSHIESEDLTQDIALQIITSLNKGTIPTSFSAWVWQIARNRYSVWAKEKHKRNESVTGSDIGDYEIEDESENILDEMIHTEQVALLRRELAFIKSDYRNIVVAYYIENRNVREIAESLSLPTNTVKSRLLRARQILKEGMDMAREFGKRSYNPEQIAFVMNGKDGKKGQPWSIITHLLYKNIFLETYGNPQTAEELSLELGIALPYMEDELEFLVREQLLTKSENKYQTAFDIISKEEQRKMHDSNRKVQKLLTNKICELIDTYICEDGSKVNYDYVGYEAAKWTLIVRAFDWLKFSAHKNMSEEYRASYPSRPDDGAWTLMGYETIDFEKPKFVGQHGYLSHDVNDIKRDIDFAQFKFQYNNICEKTPLNLSWKEAYTLWLICSGRIEVCEKSYLEKLLEYGYLKKDDSIIPNVVIFDRNAEEPHNEELSQKLTSLKNEIFALFNQAPDIERGYVVEQAIIDGWLKYDDDTVNTIGAYIYL